MISTTTNTVRKWITVGKNPEYIAITPNGKTAYVANTGSLGMGDTVTPISTVTNTAGKAIKVGKGPALIAITPNGKTAYVVNGNSGTVTRSAPPRTRPAKRSRSGASLSPSRSRHSKPAAGARPAKAGPGAGRLVDALSAVGELGEPRSHCNLHSRHAVLGAVAVHAQVVRQAH